jgi:hypothetical protein
MAALQLQSGQNQQASRGELLQERAGCEVIDSATRVAPIPRLAKFTRQALAAPLRMIGNPLT